MNTKIDKISGRVLFHDSKKLWVSNGYGLRCISKKDGSCISTLHLHKSIFLRFIIKFNFLARLFRLGIYNLFEISPNKLLIFIDKEIWLYTLKNESILNKLRLNHSRVLHAEDCGNFILFGDYQTKRLNGSSNFIWEFNKELLTFSQLESVDNVRHIHAVCFDKFSKKTYVTTGDDNHECNIFEFNRVSGLKKIFSGSQFYRAVQINFSKDFIYIGTDNPDGNNFIYSVSKQDKKIEILAELQSPIYFSASCNDNIYFGTACENKSRHEVSIYRLDSNNNALKILSDKKDFYNCKYFQYGNVFFANSKINNDGVWAYFFGTSMHNISVKID